MLPEQVIRNAIGRSSDDLLPVVAGIQPRMVVGGTAVKIVGADFRLAQKHGVSDYRGVCKMVSRGGRRIPS